MTAHSELVARLEGASEVLRESAEWKAKVLGFPGYPNTLRDTYADAVAVFAETVVEILRAQPQPDGEKT